MSVVTVGKIKGYMPHEDLLRFIKEKYDGNAKDRIEREVERPVSEINWDYKMNEHSEDNINAYVVSGYIDFDYHYEQRSMYYHYTNVNHLENLEYYSEYGLRDMVEAETTHIQLGCWGSSVDIIKEIIGCFGGGWMDENDCDDMPYFYIPYCGEIVDQ